MRHRSTASSTRVMVERAGDERLEAAAHEQIGLQAAAARLDDEAQRDAQPPPSTMSSTLVRNTSACARPLPRTSISTARKARPPPPHRPSRPASPGSGAPSAVLAQHAGEQLDERHAPDRAALGRATTPSERIAHADVAAVRRVPFLDAAGRPFAALGSVNSASRPAMRLVLASSAWLRINAESVPAVSRRHSSGRAGDVHHHGEKL